MKKNIYDQLKDHQTSREKSIIFNSEMVKAILTGRKTQTRKVIKPQLIQPREDAYFDTYNGGPQWNWWSPDNKQFLTQIIKCPYGKVGERLWVRETWYDAFKKTDYDSGCIYRATQNRPELDHQWEWRSSIHMPRWASRITLEITDVRVERVQDINGEDAIKEGIPWHQVGSEYQSINDIRVNKFKITFIPFH